MKNFKINNMAVNPVSSEVIVLNSKFGIAARTQKRISSRFKSRSSYSNYESRAFYK